MSSYRSPTKKRPSFMGDTSTVDYSAKLGSTSTGYNDLKSRFDDIMNDVDEKKHDANRGVK